MKYFLLGLVSAAIFASCCDPKARNSFPLVIDSSYSVQSVKDAKVPVPPDYVLDSGYYPIYSIDIKNTGTEADTFRLVISPPYSGQYVVTPDFQLTDKHYVEPGQTATFRTYGPVPPNALDTAKYRYLFFFTSTPDSVSLPIFRPWVQIFYGKSIDGPETCGTPETSLDVNVDNLGKK
ncbi:MAG: hypothetical protein JSS75_05810 [Bacteroidetes bacterium]|nr:hypothetical protein [Bacteroidota bacterium]